MKHGLLIGESKARSEMRQGDLQCYTISNTFSLFLYCLMLVTMRIVSRMRYASNTFPNKLNVEIKMKNNLSKKSKEENSHKTY